MEAQSFEEGSWALTWKWEGSPAPLGLETMSVPLGSCLVCRLGSCEQGGDSSLQSEVLQAQSSCARSSVLHVTRKTVPCPSGLVMDAGRGRRAATRGGTQEDQCCSVNSKKSGTRLLAYVDAQ